MIKEQLSYQTRCRRRENIHQDFNQFDVIRLGERAPKSGKKALPQMTREHHLSLSVSPRGCVWLLFAGEKGEKRLERSHTQNMKLFPRARYKLDPLFFCLSAVYLSVEERTLYTHRV
jgi:hypothetical protein